VAEETQQGTDWQDAAMALAADGKSAEEIAAAVDKHAATIRKLIKRKTESGEFVPPGPGTAGGVQPVEVVGADQAARLAAVAGDSAGDDPEPELFPMGTVAGDGLGLKHLIRPGADVSMTISLMSAEIPAPREGGLLKPEQEVYLLVAAEPQKYIPVPEKEGDRGDRKVTGWKIRQAVRPLHVQRVTGDAVMVQAAFRALVDTDQARAGQLLDSLNAAYREALSQ